MYLSGLIYTVTTGFLQIKPKFLEKDRAGWNVALGSDQGGNIDGSPVFRKRGFDESGVMRESDYRLGRRRATTVSAAAPPDQIGRAHV